QDGISTLRQGMGQVMTIAYIPVWPFFPIRGSTSGLSTAKESASSEPLVAVRSPLERRLSNRDRPLQTVVGIPSVIVEPARTRRGKRVRELRLSIPNGPR